MEREADPRLVDFSDKARKFVEDGDWRGACGIIEDMWHAKLDPDAWMYSMAIDACVQANETEGADKLREELRQWGDQPTSLRFQLAPVCQWHRQLKRAGCSIHNTLDWKGQERPPKAPEGGPCWLLPAQDELAEDIALNEKELRHAGWKVVACNPKVVAVLRNKNELHELADSLNLTAHMPERYESPGSAAYPCILKPAQGTWGKDTHIVYSSEEVLRYTRPGKIYEVERQAEQQLEYKHSYLEQSGQEQDSEEAWRERTEAADEAVREWLAEAEWEDVGGKWLMQELASGKYEYSTSLLVEDGKILDAVCSRYEYSSDVYVWPALEYLKSEYVSVPRQHLAVMSSFLVGFSGICNFNYKLRPDGGMCIFEVNPRVGGDLVFDVPKNRVRVMFEKLDAMFS